MTAWLDLSWYYKAQEWVKKRRKAILWAAAATGAGVCVYYAASWYRLRMQEREENAARLSLLQKEAEERVDAQLQHHFESIQNISDSTTLSSMLPPLRDRLFRLLDLSALTKRLAAGKRDPQALSSQEKMQLWNQLKIVSFTRTVSAMSALGLLHLLVRTQMNILGRHMYIGTARDLSASEGQELRGSYPSGWQQRFLASAEFLPHGGIDRLVEDVLISVEEIMANVPLTQPLDSYQLKELLAQILAKFLNRQLEWEYYLLPSEDMLREELEATATEGDVSHSSDESVMLAEERHDFNIVMTETRAILSSAEFHSAVVAVLDVILNEAIYKYQESISEDSTVGVPLARVIYPVANLSGSFLEHPMNNVFIAAVARHPQVRSFCAMVYASSISEGYTIESVSRLLRLCSLYKTDK